MRRDNQTAVNQTPERESIAYFVEGFLLYKDGMSPRTLEWYSNILGNFAWWLRECNHLTKLKDVTAEDVMRFLNYLRTAQPQGRWGRVAHNTVRSEKPNTVHSYARAIKTFFGWCVKRRYIERSPFEGGDVPMPKLPEPDVQPFSEDDILKLVAAAKEAAAQHRHSANRNVAIIWTMASSGLRISELCAIKLATSETDSDYKWSTGAIEVRSGKGGKRRTVYVGRTARQAIWEYMSSHRPDDGEGWLFLTEDGSQLNRNSVSLILQRLGKKAEVELPRSHRFRHYFATQALKNRAPQLAVQHLMGHSSDKMMKVYVSIAGLDLQKMHKGFDPVDNMGESKGRPRKPRRL